MDWSSPPRHLVIIFSLQYSNSLILFGICF
jgi:hypothetical protein